MREIINKPRFAPGEWRIDENAFQAAWMNWLTNHAGNDLDDKVAFRHAIGAYVAAIPSEISVKNAEAALVDYFKQRVRQEFPDATVVPSDEHHRQRAEPIIRALLPYLRTHEPVSLSHCAGTLYENKHHGGTTNDAIILAKTVLEAAGVPYVED